MTQYSRTPYFPKDLHNYAPWVAYHGLHVPYGECQCGCGQDVLPATYTRPTFGYVKDAPQRFINGHAGKSPPLTPEERFWAKVDRSAPDGCWNWIASRNKKGYGHFCFDNRVYQAHRFCYAMHYGSIPDGMYICHHCDNPSCVRPEHLFLGTHEDNTKDMIEKGRHLSPSRPKGELNGFSSLTDTQVMEIRHRYAQGGITQATLGNEYGVCQTTISAIVRRKRWQHIP